MADYNNQQSGYMGQEEEQRTRLASGYNAHQDEFGFKEGNDPRQPSDFGRGYEGQGYGDQGYQGYGDRTGETFQEGPERRRPTGYGDTDSGVGGPKSGYGASQEGGAYDHATSEQSQFGLEGKTGSYGKEASDPQLGATDTSSYGAVDPLKSDFDKAPHGVESVPAGDGWGAEDTCKLPLFTVSEYSLYLSFSAV